MGCWSLVLGYSKHHILPPRPSRSPCPSPRILSSATNSSTGDGLVAALQILRIMKERDARLSELRNCWTRFPQLVTNVRVREKKPFDQLDGVLGLVAGAEGAVAKSGGRVLLRYSGTEPKARLLIEGRDRAELEAWTKKICDAIRAQVGA
ncbi:MAG: hypothetical protein HC841_09205 [Verrucomicrobiae bacterium]|nr:hypothetical protein [Verrucomicrobiae bacterium]